MRFLEELQNPEVAQGLSDLLTDRGIEHKFEKVLNTDWGSDQYGETIFRVWIIDEDAYDQAVDLAKLYREDPTNETLKLKSKLSLQKKRQKKTPIVPLIPEPTISLNEPVPITRFITLLCCLLFILQTFTTPSKPHINSRLWVPSTINQTLLFDYPQAAEEFTRAFYEWGNSDLDSISSEGQILLKKALTTPFWQGYYNLALDHLNGIKTSWKGHTWFEKISQGEYWRLFSPAFLHANLLHIIFNLLWFWMLGKEVERSIGAWRFVLLVLSIAVFSNTLQYLMSGFDFLGLSGVVAGLLFFIGERQRKAPWEGYTLQSSVYYFLLIYIFGLAAIQAISFLLSWAQYQPLPLSIANTAHIAGAFIGFVLGRWNAFSWKG